MAHLALQIFFDLHSTFARQLRDTTHSLRLGITSSFAKLRLKIIERMIYSSRTGRPGLVSITSYVLRYQSVTVVQSRFECFKILIRKIILTPIKLDSHKQTKMNLFKVFRNLTNQSFYSIARMLTNNICTGAVAVVCAAVLGSQSTTKI